MLGPATPGVEEYESWRRDHLREALAKLTRRYKSQQRAADAGDHNDLRREHVALAGPSLLPQAPAGREVRLAAAAGKHSQRLRRIRRSVAPVTDPESGAVHRPKGAPPGRFVCDRFAGQREIAAVLGYSQQCDWWHSPHSFETIPIAKFVAHAALLPGGPAAVASVSRLRNAARECVCKALELDQVLYHAHATITRTRSPTAVLPLSDDDALKLFNAIELKDSANAEYRRGMYESAIRMYTHALDGLPDALRSTHAEVAIILSNRAAAFSQLQDFRKVIYTSYISVATSHQPPNRRLTPYRCKPHLTSSDVARMIVGDRRHDCGISD